MATRYLKVMVNRAPTNEIYKKPYIKRRHKIPCIIKEGTSMLHPHFIIQSDAVPKILDYNYCYSYDTKYDYYIDDKIMLPQGQVELVCTIDPLYTFRDAILELTVHEERSTEGESNLIVDEQVPVMHNLVVDKIINMPMKVDSQFSSENQIIVTTTTGNQFSYTSVDVTPQNIGTIKACLSDDAYKIARAITTRALKYWDDYENLYVNTVKEYSKTFARNTLFPIVYAYAQDSHYEASFYCNDDGQSGFLSREQTHYADENGSGLTYIDGSTYPNDTPQTLIDGGVVWTAWDCAQFAWRCVRFNSERPINIAKIDSADALTTIGSSATKDLATSMASKYVTYSREDESGVYHTETVSLDVTDSIESIEDLVKGDIILSWNLAKNRPKYWVYEVEISNSFYWYSTASVVSDSGNIDKDLYDRLKALHPNVDRINNIYGVNHARVYIGNGEYIDSVGRNANIPNKYGSAATSEYQSKDVLHSSLGKRTISNLTVRYIDFSFAKTNPFDLVPPLRQVLIDSQGYACHIFRPALLGNDGKQIPYTEWRNREG